MSVPQVVWDGWDSVARVAAGSAVIYVVIVLVLRVVGQRALAKMSAYDLIVTVALGSLIAQIPLTKSISVVDGLVVIGVYLGLQELTSWAQTRSARVHHLVRERPNLVVWDGRFLRDRMRDINVTPDEVRAAIRRAGMISLSQVQVVVLENDGEWAVIRRSNAPDLSALVGLEIPGYTWDDAAHELWGEGDMPVRPLRAPRGDQADTGSADAGSEGDHRRGGPGSEGGGGELPHTGSGGVL